MLSAALSLGHRHCRPMALRLPLAGVTRAVGCGMFGAQEAVGVGVASWDAGPLHAAGRRWGCVCRPWRWGRGAPTLRPPSGCPAAKPPSPLRATLPWSPCCRKLPGPDQGSL